MTERLTRRKILSLTGAASGVAILPIESVGATDSPDDELHTSMHDLGVFNNSSSNRRVRVRLQSKTSEERSEHGTDMFEVTRVLPGINQSRSVTSSEARFIAAVTVPGSGWYEMTIEVDGETATEDVLLDETGIVDYGSVGAYVDPDGTPAVRWSMA